MPQHFHQVTTMENEGQRKTTQQLQTAARMIKKLEMNCSYCHKQNDREKARNAGNGTLRTRKLQQNTDLSTIEDSCVRSAGTLDNQPSITTKDTKMHPHTTRYHTRNIR